MIVKDLVYTTYRDLLDEFNLHPESLDEDTVVFGTGGITSLQLVRLIVDLEDRVQEATGQFINLTDDSVLSLKNSPFATLGVLVPFVEAKMKSL